MAQGGLWEDTFRAQGVAVGDTGAPHAPHTLLSVEGGRLALSLPGGVQAGPGTSISS